MNNLKRFTIFLLLPLLLLSQKSDYSEEISNYLESNGTMLQYEYAYAELMKMLSGHYPENEVNAHKWKYLKDNRSKALKEMKLLLIPIYQKNFTKSDINEMLAFYKTDAGSLLMKDRSKMTKAHTDELKAFYNSRVGKKISAKKEILTREISRVSESWSRNLYVSSISVLKHE